MTPKIYIYLTNPDLAKLKLAMNLTIWDFIKSILKSILWIFLNLFYGLAPILIILYQGSLDLRKDASSIAQHELTTLIKECSILFIFCVMMGAVTIDFLFSKVKMTKVGSAMLIALSIIPLLLICIPYAFIVFDNEQAHTFNNLMSLTNWFVAYCILYCIISKTIFFIKEEYYDRRSF